MRITSAAGTIRRALPDVDVDTGAVSRQLRGLPDGAQQRVLRNMRALSDDTTAALDATAVEAPAAKAAKIARYTGANGRRALNELASVGTAPVSRLLRTADDVATMRAMVRAWSRHDLETDELRTMLQRYRSMDADRRAEYSEVLKAGDDSVHRASTDLDQDELNAVLDADADLSRKAAVFRGVDDAGADNLGDSVEVRQGTLDYLEAEGEGSARILRTEVCWNPCEEWREFTDDFKETVHSSDTFADFGEEELDDILDELTATANAYKRNPPADARSPKAVAEDVQDIADAEVPGIARAVEHGRGSPNNFKGLDGEVQIGTDLLERSDNPTIDAMEVELSNSRGSSEIDLDLREEHGIAIESKNRDYREVPEFLLEQEDTPRPVDDLANKFEVVTNDPDVDEYVVVTRTEDARSSPVVQQALEEADITDAEAEKIRFEHYDDVSDINQ